MTTRSYNNGGASLLRLPDVGLAPQGLALDTADGLLFVHNFLSRDVAVYDVRTVLANVRYEAPRLGSVRTVATERLSEQVLRGKRIFYNAADGRMNKDGYVTCATCHLEGGSDRRVWDFTDRGEGLRRTTVLTGRGGMAHGPVHWSANFDEIQDFEHDMRGPMQGAGFLDSATFHAGTRNTTLGDKKAGLSEDLDALAAYVASLDRFPVSPFRNPDGSWTADAASGKSIFESRETGCVRCHVPPRYTDSRLPHPGDSTPVLGPGDFLTPQGFLLHDVGTLKPSSGKRLNDTLKGLDTPTLLGVWDGGPYLHDGSAATLMDIVTTANAGDKHGKTSHLTETERNQLVAFLLQLDGYGAAAGLGPDRPAPPAPRLAVFAIPQRGLRNAWSLSSWPVPGRIVLRIFDGSGRRLRQLDSPPTARGAAIWDLRDGAGRTVGRGIYWVRLEAGTASATARAAVMP
jgi:cytochrome c peroxidase